MTSTDTVCLYVVTVVAVWGAVANATSGRRWTRRRVRIVAGWSAVAAAALLPAYAQAVQFTFMALVVPCGVAAVRRSWPLWLARQALFLAGAAACYITGA